MLFWCCVGVDWIANKEILLSACTVNLCVRHGRIGACCIRYVRLSVRVSAWNSATPHGLNSVKFRNGDVYKSLLTPNLLKSMSRNLTKNNALSE